MTTPVFYLPPEAEGQTLRVPPALASGDRGGAAGQTRSVAFIEDVRSLVTEQLPATPDPLALRLEVGLAEKVPLLALNDLDNYLFPLVPKVAAATGRRFTSVWASKRHAPTSTVAVGQARPASDPGGAYSFQVRTTASAETTAYKVQIRDQLTAVRPLPDGAVTLQLAFVVGPRRVWPNLWKATIDALGPILGRDAGAQEWNTRDGRITDLGLHCVVDPTAGDAVTVAIRADG